MRMNKKGFTLIELVIVLVIVGILAAVALPRFSNIQDDAKDSSVKGTVGNVRSALSIARSEFLIANDSNSNNYWPTLAEVQASATSAALAIEQAGNDNCPMSNVMPQNPWNGSNTVRVGTNARLVTGIADGWCYVAGTGLFYANSDSTSADGTAFNENDF